MEAPAMDTDATRDTTQSNRDTVAVTGKTCGPGDAGSFLTGCRIDLPPDDVVEEIEFERFFRLNLTFADLHGSAQEDTNLRNRFRVRFEEPVPDAAAIDVGALPVALYMPFTQQWKLDGYNRVRVVNSFTLGPGEEQTVEIFTSDR